MLRRINTATPRKPVNTMCSDFAVRAIVKAIEETFVTSKATALLADIMDALESTAGSYQVKEHEGDASALTRALALHLPAIRDAFEEHATL